MCADCQPEKGIINDEIDELKEVGTSTSYEFDNIQKLKEEERKERERKEGESKIVEEEQRLQDERDRLSQNQTQTQMDLSPFQVKGLKAGSS